jgi:hypothetical protein
VLPPLPPRGATGPVAATVGPTTGNTGAVKAGRPAGAPTRADRTPPSPVRPRQQPNRKFEHRTGPSMLVIGGLLLAAFVVALVLWVTMGTDGGTNGVTETTVVAGDTAAASTVAPVAGQGILAVRSFDPDGDDGVENDDQAALAIDGNTDTAWQTVCYSDRYLGGKGGVGLVADLGADRTGTLQVVLGSAPYQVRMYAVGDGQNPTTFAAWGSPLQSFDGTETDTLSLTLAQPARYVLVSFIELGENNDCANNPYRGSIRELTFG